MKIYRYFIFLSSCFCLGFLFSACAPSNTPPETPPETMDLPADGECPPGYHPVYAPAGGWGGYCELNTPPEGDCPPGYHPVLAPAGGWGGYCELNSPTDGDCPPGSHPVYAPAGGWGGYCQYDSPPSESVPMDEDGGCPPGYVAIYAPAGGWGGYCQLVQTATPFVVVQSSDKSVISLPKGTSAPAAQSSRSNLPEQDQGYDVIQYCANNGANIGGANISYPSDYSLHVDDWFSENPGHVQCTDDTSNPRICWGPESSTFEPLLCNGNQIQNQDYACKTIQVTLGSCAQPRKDKNSTNPEPGPTSCVHC